MSNLWPNIQQHCQQWSDSEPIMQTFLQKNVLSQNSLVAALAQLLANKLCDEVLCQDNLLNLAKQTFSEEEILSKIHRDLNAVFERDSACQHQAVAFLFYKGFHALQAYRLAHALWPTQEALALLLQSKISSVFDVDIHPAAVMGSGIMLDHATGIVVGETARVGDDVSIMQDVTLGGTGKEDHDRHPKIGNNVLISCGAKILGNIEIGEGAKIAAGSVVLKPVAEHTTVAGVPAKAIGQPQTDEPALTMNHNIDCDAVNEFLK